ncbi:MAG: hypothetical protein ACLTSZ_06410 [Lachnospiraceae bacterium]
MFFGAIAVGRQAIGVHHRPKNVSEKQACAAIGQAIADDDSSEAVQ